MFKEQKETMLKKAKGAVITSHQIQNINTETNYRKN